MARVQTRRPFLGPPAPPLAEHSAGGLTKTQRRVEDWRRRSGSVDCGACRRLVVRVVARDAGERILELSHPRAERAADLRQALPRIGRPPKHLGPSDGRKVREGHPYESGARAARPLPAGSSGIGFPLAVNRKYSDDQGRYLTATVTYYGFFFIFPLLLVLTTILGFVFHGHPHLHRRSRLGARPVPDRRLRAQIGLAHREHGGARDRPRRRTVGGDGRRPRRRIRDGPCLGFPPYVGRISSARGCARCSCSPFSAAACSPPRRSRVPAPSAPATASTGRSPPPPLRPARLRALLDRIPGADDTRRPLWGLRAGAVAAAIGYEALQLLGGYYVGRVLKNPPTSTAPSRSSSDCCPSSTSRCASRSSAPRSTSSPQGDSGRAAFCHQARRRTFRPNPVPADN